jgi:hypothetical protein
VPAMNNLTRRSAITASASVTCWAVATCKAEAEEAPATEGAAAVAAAEDLMREHGVLNRLMLVYEAALAPQAVAREDTELFPAFLGIVIKVIAPTVATIRLPRSPLPTAIPTVRKIHPPSRAPITPTTRSPTRPCSLLPMTCPASHPADKPIKMNQTTSTSREPSLP